MVGLLALILCLLFAILQQKSLNVLAKRQVRTEHKLYQALKQLRAANLAAPGLHAVFLVQVPADKNIRVMKELRIQTGMGLKDAKDAVSTLPSLIALDCLPEKAEEIRAAFAKLDAQVDMV